MHESLEQTYFCIFEASTFWLHQAVLDESLALSMFDWSLVKADLALLKTNQAICKVDWALLRVAWSSPVQGWFEDWLELL